MLSFVSVAVLSVLLTFYVGATNVITSIVAGTTMTAGQAFVITWQSDSSSTVTLILRKGEATNLENVGTIAIVANTGSYTWYPGSDLVSADDYALEILGSDGVQSYSHYFALENSAMPPSSSGSTAVSTASVTSRTTTGSTPGLSTTTSASTIKTTTLPSSLVTDSLISSVSSMASRNSTSSASSSHSGSSGSSASISVSRTASHSVASASASSSARALIVEVVGRTRLMTFLALCIASMIFCMM